jgi:hypothetical protein
MTLTLHARPAPHRLDPASGRPHLGPVGPAETARQQAVAALHVSPTRAHELLTLMRQRGLTQWPPPAPTPGERREHHAAQVTRFGPPAQLWPTRWGRITPATGGPHHPDPARRLVYYTGVGHPNLLNHSPVPLFLSATTLAAYRSRGEDFPVQMTGGAGWAGDSGAYTALTGTNPDHPWHLDPGSFGGLWVRLGEDIGPPDFVAIQDWPCEPAARARTGLSVREYQELTLESYLYLAEQFPMVAWIPVLQGWAPAEYDQHADRYERAGVDLAGCHRVGLGSICRRASDTDIAALVARLATRGLRLHGFGVSINGLRRIGHLLASADSQAWSATARRERIHLPGCEHWSRPDPTGQRHRTDCRNCFRYALHYREEILQAIRDSADQASHQPPALFDLAPTQLSTRTRPTSGLGRPPTSATTQPTLFA